MKSKLISLLETLGFDVYEQGSFTTTDDYPSSFFTFWNYESNIDKYYSNKPIRCVWKFWVNFYSKDPGKPEEIMEATRLLLLENGWIVTTKGIDIQSDSKEHFGRELNAYFIEKLGG